MAKLWDFINGEPFLVNPGDKVGRTPKKSLFYGKTIELDSNGKARIFLCNPPQPFRRLPSTCYVEIEDICRWCQISRNAVKFHLKTGALKPSKKVGRQLFFLHKDVVEWDTVRRRKTRGGPLPKRLRQKGGES